MDPDNVFLQIFIEVMDSSGKILVLLGVEVVFWATGSVEFPGLALAGSGLRESLCPGLGNTRLPGNWQGLLTRLSPGPGTGTGPSILLLEGLEGPGPGGVVPVVAELPLVNVETWKLAVPEAGEAEIGVQRDTGGRGIWG